MNADRLRWFNGGRETIRQGGGVARLGDRSGSAIRAPLPAGTPENGCSDCPAPAGHGAAVIGGQRHADTGIVDC